MPRSVSVAFHDESEDARQTELPREPKPIGSRSGRMNHRPRFCLLLAPLASWFQMGDPERPSQALVLVECNQQVRSHPTWGTGPIHSPGPEVQSDPVELDPSIDLVGQSQDGSSASSDGSSGMRRPTFRTPLRTGARQLIAAFAGYDGKYLGLDHNNYHRNRERNRQELSMVSSCGIEGAKSRLGNMPCASTCRTPNPGARSRTDAHRGRGDHVGNREFSRGKCRRGVAS